MHNISIIFSLAILILTLISAITAPRLFKKQYKIKRIYIIITGVFISILSIMLYVDYQPDIYSSATTFPLALFHTIQIMLVNYSFSDLYDAYSSASGLSFVPYCYFAVLLTIAPLCTFGFVLSFFESIVSYIKILFAYKKDVYIMSGLSEKSVILAESIRNKFPKSAILFVNVFAKDEKTFNLVNSAEKFNAIFSKFDVEDSNLNLHSKKSKITFFAIDEDESHNVETAMSIIEKFRTRNNTEVYVFSTSKEGGLLLDSIDYGCMKVRRINDDQALAYSIIFDKENLITKYAVNTDDEKTISALVIGFGGYGTEITKALLWCGQLPDYNLEINVIDKNESAESIFSAQCPEIMSLNNNTEPGEAKYSLKIYNGTDVTSQEFNNIVSSLKKTSVVYISLGNDALNIETAIQVRILLERAGVYPVIRAVVHSDLKNDILTTKGLINYKNQNYDIETIGNFKARFSYDTIINEELEDLALIKHLQWANTPESKEYEVKKFNEIEYFRNSSTVSALYDIYRRSEKLSDETASLYEHIRWNAYMRTEGYIYSGSNDKSTRNDRAKMHYDLVSHSRLTDDELAKDRRMSETK